MNILFLTLYYPPEVNAPASRTSEHAARWAAAGHDVTVLTCNPNCPDGVVFDGYATSTLNVEAYSQVAFEFAVTPDLLMLGVYWALVLGLVGGLLPAMRAARLPILNALRAA